MSDTMRCKVEKSKPRKLAHRLARLLRFLFVRRLAIVPQCAGGGAYHDFGRVSKVPSRVPQKWLFEWQKMPKGYRWF